MQRVSFLRGFSDLYVVPSSRQETGRQATAPPPTATDAAGTCQRDQLTAANPRLMRRTVHRLAAGVSLRIRRESFER